MRLIDVTQTSVHPVQYNGWCLIFGEGIVGREVGAAYLIPGKPHYARLKVIAQPQPEGSDQPPIPVYQPISERPLTAEEIAHLEALAESVEV